jgi:hypothetical protein
VCCPSFPFDLCVTTFLGLPIPPSCVL